MNNLKPYADVKQWFNMGDHEAIEFDGEKYTVKTLEGKAEIQPGDWLIGPGKQNEYWPISNDIFKKKYCLGF